MSKAMYALGRLKVGAMNKTEAAYDTHLAALQHAGENFVLAARRKRKSACWGRCCD